MFVKTITVALLAMVSYWYPRSANARQPPGISPCQSTAFLEWIQTVLPELKLQNAKDNLQSNQPKQDNRPAAVDQCHEDSAEIIGESFDVNENDVRDQDRPATESGQPRHEESAEVVGESFDVNENDVRDQEGPDMPKGD